MLIKKLYDSGAYTVVYVSSSVNGFRPGEARTEDQADRFVLPEVIVSYLSRHIVKTTTYSFSRAASATR